MKPLPLPLIAAVGILLIAPPGHAQVLVNDTFSDNERSTQSPPSSLSWIVGAHNGTAANAFGTLDASGGNLVLDHTQSPGVNSFAVAIGYFTVSGSPVVLSMGETLTLSFDVSFSNGSFQTNNGAFRWALFDSGGSRVSADFAGNNAPGISSGTTFNGYRGYEAQSRIDGMATPNAMFTRERTGSGAGLFNSTEWAAQLGSETSSASYAANVTYGGSLILERTASGVNVQGSLNGATTSSYLDTTPVTQFDTIAFFTVDGLSHDLTFDNVNVTVTPEPAAGSLLAMAGLSLLSMRRRRRA